MVKYNVNVDLNSALLVEAALHSCVSIYELLLTYTVPNWDRTVPALSDGLP